MNHLIAFQKKNGLVADGIIGTNTLRKMREVFNLPSNSATAHFAGQLAHETSNFTRGEENLNYSAKRLQQIFLKYFPTWEKAEKYARNPVKIASRVYANRMGNGDEKSKDGWLYRGRGSIQLTGKSNYEKFGKYIGQDLQDCPDMVITHYYFECALWYFDANRIWRYTGDVTEESIKKVTKAINGGYNGLDHRTNLTRQFYLLLDAS